jgi:hypothetical protein
VIQFILAAFEIRAIEPRIGCQFNPSVEYAILAVVSIALAPDEATPPATNTPAPAPVAPNAMALHVDSMVSELGTSLQLIPS